MPSKSSKKGTPKKVTPRYGVRETYDNRTRIWTVNFPQARPDRPVQRGVQWSANASTWRNWRPMPTNTPRWAQYSQDPLTPWSRPRVLPNTGIFTRRPMGPNSRRELRDATNAWSRQYPVQIHEHRVPKLSELARRALPGWEAMRLKSDGSFHEAPEPRLYKRH